MITIKLFAFFRKELGKETSMEYSSNLTVEDVVRHLNIEPKQVAILLVNGKHQKLDYVVNDNDKIYLFPPVAGG